MGPDASSSLEIPSPATVAWVAELLHSKRLGPAAKGDPGKLQFAETCAAARVWLLARCPDGFTLTKGYHHPTAAGWKPHSLLHQVFARRQRCFQERTARRQQEDQDCFKGERAAVRGTSVWQQATAAAAAARGAS